MIKFHTLSWKNFLSTGNTTTTIQLDGKKKTVFLGESGSGKSTILDAITFVLYNKPFRDINKGALVNSINERECLVEVTFSIGTIQYRIVRGIKPNVFEIYKDDQLINQDAKSLDYQKMLEDNILKFNLKAFCQIVTLGAASFTPFMQLGSSDRRSIIEEILGIEIFSHMTAELKERLKTVKDAVKDTTYKKSLAEEKKIMKQKYLETVTKDNQAQIDTKTNEHDQLYKTTKGLLAEQASQKEGREATEQLLAEAMSLLEGEDEISAKIATASDAVTKLEKKAIELEAKCKQEITESTNTIKNSYASKIQLLKTKCVAAWTQHQESINSVVREHSATIKVLSADLPRLQKRLEYYQTTDVCNVCEQPISAEVKSREIETCSKEIADITSKVAELKELSGDLNVKMLQEIARIKEESEREISEVGDGKEEIETSTAEIEQKYAELLAKNRESIVKFTEAKDVLVAKRDSYLPARKKIEEIKAKIFEQKTEERLTASTILHNQKTMEKLKSEIEALSTKPKNMDAVLKEMKAIDTELSEAKALLERLSVEGLYGEIAERMLKDDGIKSQIIKQYLPVINQSINDYLQKMDFYVTFNLDENFNETILSRGRDTFSYCNFSEGEKQRINIAILFTWRMIAKMKNSMSTNLLIMDEIFDSYLDPEATENALKLLDTPPFDGSNVIIISHKASIGDKFDRVGNFYKQGNFSMVDFV